jgi:multimeric flavodoxin WrbA
MGKKKRAVILQGSPRKKGNTAIALGRLEDALEAAGYRLVRHELYRLDFRGCVHCDHCKSRERRPACKLKDDLTEVLDDAHRAALVVVASPVYCWKVSGSASTALDRFYCFFKNSGQSLLAGKQLAGVFTAGGDANDGLDLCQEMLKRLAAFGQARYAGSLVAAGCRTPAETRQRRELVRQARALVQGLG